MGIFSGGSFPTSGGTVIITQDGYQTLNLTGNILTISGSNSSVDLSSYLDDTNTTNASLTLNASNVLTLTDSDSGTVTVDLTSLVTAAGGTAESTHIAVKNTSGATITKGTPVYITGNVGASDRLQIAPADASDPAKMPAIGLLETDLSNNGEGYVVQGGYLRGLTTNIIDGTSTSSNDTVYVKVGGGLTMTKPTGSSNYIQNIAKVARVGSGSSGSLIVSSILRTNDIPNLADGQVWVGSTTYPVSTDFNLQEVTDGGNTTTNSLYIGYNLYESKFISWRGSNGGTMGLQANNNITTNGTILLQTGLSKSFAVKVNNNDSFANVSSTDFIVKESGNVGINKSYPDAKLHVVGSGNTSATTALLVENSDGTNLIEVTDGGNAIMNVNYLQIDEFVGGRYLKITPAVSGASHKIESNSGSSIEVSSSTGLNYTLGGSGQLTLNQYTSANFNGTPTSFLGVDASGNVIKTTSAGVLTPTLQEVTDAGNTTTNNITVGEYIYGDTTTTNLRLSTAAGSILNYGTSQFINGGSLVFKVGGNTYFRINSGDGNVGINKASSLGAKLHVVGADDLFATKALLVENNSGTDIFYVTNEGIAGFYKHGITNALHITGKQTYSGNYSTLVGHQAGGGSGMTGSYQAIFGAYAGDLITGNSTNATIIGGAAGYQANAPINSVMVGYHSGSTSDGNNNVFVGYYTRNKYGSNNVMIGRQAGDQSYGGQNVYIGSLAGYAIGASGNNSDNNVFIGYEAGRLTKDGVDRNIFLGYRAGYNTPNLGSGNTVIGDRILENSTEALSNTVVIGAGGNERLRFDSAGQLQLNNYTSTNFDGTPTKILGVDASGNVVKTTRTYQTKSSLSFDSVGESTVTLPSTALYGVTATLESSAAEFIVIAQYLAGTSVKFKLYDHTGSAVTSVTRTVHYTYTI